MTHDAVQQPTESYWKPLLVPVCELNELNVLVSAHKERAALKPFHNGHLGINRMKFIARSYEYWSEIDADIENMAGKCQKCQQAAKNPVRQDRAP